MLHFVEERQQCVRRLVLMNSEGYWSGEPDTACTVSADDPQHPSMPASHIPATCTECRGCTEPKSVQVQCSAAASSWQAVHRSSKFTSLCAWPADEGDFVNLQSKHNFTMAHFGLLLGVLKNNLQELQIQHCNDIFCRTHQVGSHNGHPYNMVNK